MKYLLDTHVILWALENDPKLSSSARVIVESLENQCFVSIISFYEIAIKKNIGKFSTHRKISDFMIEIEKMGLEVIDISPRHLDIFEELPTVEVHKDPFDRLIIATAIEENLEIISIDDKFQYYKDLVKIIW